MPETTELRHPFSLLCTIASCRHLGASFRTKGTGLLEFTFLALALLRRAHGRFRRRAPCGEREQPCIFVDSSQGGVSSVASPIALAIGSLESLLEAVAAWSTALLMLPSAAISLPADFLDGHSKVMASRILWAH